MGRRETTRCHPNPTEIHTGKVFASSLSFQIRDYRVLSKEGAATTREAGSHLITALCKAAQTEKALAVYEDMVLANTRITTASQPPPPPLSPPPPPETEVNLILLPPLVYAVALSPAIPRIVSVSHKGNCFMRRR